MRLLVLGGTGRLGRLVVAEALDRGHEVSVLARSATDLDGTVAVVEGDARDPAAVSRAVEGQAAVVFAVGWHGRGRTTLFSDSTRVLLDAMGRHGVPRLICVTGVGAGATRGHGGFLYDRVFFPLFTRRIYEDKDRQEALVRQSALDWTLVRPASFRNQPPKGAFHVATDDRLDGLTLVGIAVSEVATFLLDELDQGRHVRQAVFIGHE